MQFAYQRSYRGRLQAVILDWAGTTVDFGSMASVRAFMQLFEQQGVPVTLEEARAPMGTEKREHITRITQMAAVHRRWIERYGSGPTEADIDRLYEEFVPLQIAYIAEFAAPVPGCLDAVAKMRERGYRIGANTGYNRQILEVLESAAAELGYKPDSNVCATDVPRARPFPHMSLCNAIELGVETVHACVKVDDTIPGIEEGLNAGMWTIGVAVSGNEVGLSLAEWQGLAAMGQQARRAQAYRRLHMAGAHYTIDSVADIMTCLEDIESRLARGEKP